jgi:hypothetical protein
MIPPFTTLRSFVSYQFSMIRMQALRKRFWEKLTGNESALAVFPKKDQRLSPTRKLIGIENIRVAQIVGTLNRETDFDSHFRPLKKHSLDRWVNAYLLREQDGWAPILVHKVGEDYYVEDGHHRVSVARAVGMDFIEAEVWEYSYHSPQRSACPSPQGCTDQRPSRAYATG